MFQRRSHRSAPRTRSLALGGALATLAVIGGGTVVAVSAPAEVVAGDILLAQNTGAQEMELGAPVSLDLEPVVARAAGGAVPSGTSVQVTGLPDGLTQNGWVISGTPSRAGDYDVLVTVSNSGVSKSEKVTIAVTDELSAAAAPATTSAPDADQAGAGEAAESGGTTAQAAPTLSAAPGDPGLDGVPAEDGVGGATEGDDEPGTSPDLCAVLGDGGTDASSLASGLVPMLTGGDESASSGLVMMLVNAIVGMLPSLLGDSGSTEDLGSAGQLLCTISPALLGGGPVTGGDPTAGADLGEAPAALLGLLTAGAGSLGG